MNNFWKLLDVLIFIAAAALMYYAITNAKSPFFPRLRGISTQRAVIAACAATMFGSLCFMLRNWGRK